MSAVIRIKGEGRIRLVDERVVEEAKRMHPDWPSLERQLLIWDRGDIALDTGWQSNTIVDQCRYAVATGTVFGSALDHFIHQNAHPSNVLTTVLGNLYVSQSPSQVRTPDTFVIDTAALLQTRTVQYPAPAVERNINTTGLINTTAISTLNGIVFAIWAITLLSSTVVQGTAQAADVQYRVTFSLDF